MSNEQLPKASLFSRLCAALREKYATVAISFEPFQVYYRIYGRWKALAKSVYLWLSIIIAGGCYPFWMDRGESHHARPGSDILLAVTPALMAFTLAGMAVVLAMSGDKFTTAIREGGREDSLFMKIVVNFFHFVLVQSLGLILALFSRSWPSQNWLAGLAFFFTSYGVMSAVAIAAMLLNVSRIYNLSGGE